jgi:hypothetical protein
MAKESEKVLVELAGSIPIVTAVSFGISVIQCIYSRLMMVSPPAYGVSK